MDNKEIDSLVAEKIMGLNKSVWGEYLIDGVKVFEPSKNIEDAFRVMDKFDSWQLTKGDRFKEGKYRAIVEANHYVNYNDSAPKALCLAALIAWEDK